MKPHLFEEEFYLTDGGLETTLVFHYGIDLPHFAAFTLLQYPEGRAALEKYYLPYLRLAQRYGAGFILETPTWRANADWGFKLGYSAAELGAINQRAVRFVRALSSATIEQDISVLVSGNMGPRGDGYVAETTMNPTEAAEYHALQIDAFVRSNVDLVTALTINYSDEAIGIIRAASEKFMPVVISFTVETDGHLPNGESLASAIERTDQQTGAYASHYMINCAHPHHFQHQLQGDGAWLRRIKGIRANASTKSHAELDEATSLDAGDKAQLASAYEKLKASLPAMQVVGGCCGTDHSHLEQICQSFFMSRSPA